MKQAMVLKILDYNEDTGVFTWKMREGKGTFNSKHAGKVAGSVVKTGKKRYIGIRHIGNYISMHRLAVIYTDGDVIDDMEIDHINGNGQDNRRSNLRIVSKAQNAKNMKRSSANASGCTGVYRNKEGKWAAQIMSDRKRIHLGTHVNISSAVSARKAAEVKYGFHKNHGEDRPS